MDGHIQVKYESAGVSREVTWALFFVYLVFSASRLWAVQRPHIYLKKETFATTINGRTEIKRPARPIVA